MKHELTFRRAVRADLDAVQQLFVNTIRNVCTKDYSPDQIRAWTASVEDKERWTRILEAQYFILALSGDRIVGYASLKDTDYLDFLYVHHEYQRQGVASAVYSQVEEEALRRGALVFSSDVSYTARPFFESRGFSVEKENRRMIRGVEIRNYRMRKTLAGKR